MRNRALQITLCVMVMVVYGISLLPLNNAALVQEDESDLQNTVAQLQQLTQKTAGNAADIQAALQNSIEQMQIAAGLKTVIVASAIGDDEDSAGLLVVTVRLPHLLSSDLHIRPAHFSHDLASSRHDINYFSSLYPPDTPPPRV